jgi:molybdopterin/thiamine biosynthesis adenylyltransferase
MGSVTHTLTNGQTLSLPPHEEFYRQLTTRNRGILDQQEQQRLRTSPILVAGCGSIGGAAIEPLVRMGAERLLLAEPGEYDLPNMNRQAARLQDIGRNKAEVFKERMRDINPYALITVEPRGIVDETVESLVREAAVILDGVDVTTKAPLAAKYALHQQAKRFRVPVVAGYDIAGLQLLITYDYRRSDVPPLHGRIQPGEVATLEPIQFLRRVIPIPAISYEVIGELHRQLQGKSDGFPQVVYTANLFSVLALRAALNLLSGKPVKRQVMIDSHNVLRPLPEKLKVLAARGAGLAGLWIAFQRRGSAPRAELRH